jgi:cell division protein FtsZ
VTRPFGFEGKRRAVQADSGIERLRAEVDTLIVIPNDRLLTISDRNVSVLDAFKAADQVLLSGVQGITDLITTPGLINLDFADVKSVMSGAGSALMGIGSSRGDDRAVAAAEMAISSPLLEASIDGAHGVLLSIQGGSDLGLFEINEAAQLVSNSAAVDANIIFGAVIDDALGDEVRVTVIAAGFDEQRPTRSATVTPVPVPVPGGRSPATPPAAGNAVPAPPASESPVNGTMTGAPAPTLWSVNRDTGRAAPGESAPVPEPPASAAAPVAPAPVAPAPVAPAGGSGSWSAPSPQSYAPGGAGYPADPPPAARPQAGADGLAQVGRPGDSGPADPVAEVPAQPASDASSGYVPSPVSFVSDDDEDYGAKPGYGGYDSGRGAEAAPSWKDSGRAGKDRVFDVPAGHRRPVVFEEEDDLDVPDFLK